MLVKYDCATEIIYEPFVTYKNGIEVRVDLHMGLVHIRSEVKINGNGLHESQYYNEESSVQVMSSFVLIYCVKYVLWDILTLKSICIWVPSKSLMPVAWCCQE